MVKVTQKTRYAIRALLRLKTFGGVGTVLKEISKEEDIPVKFLEQIFASLAKADILESKRGAQGGYRLKKSLKEVSLYEVMKSLREDVKFAHCLDIAKPECPLKSKCKAEKFWRNIQEKIMKILMETKLEEIDESLS